MSFLSPFGALVVLVAAAPVTAFFWSERARVRVTRLLRLPEPGPRTGLAMFVKVITSAHQIGSRERRPVEWTPSPVTIGSGCWATSVSTWTG